MTKSHWILAICAGIVVISVVLLVSIETYQSLQIAAVLLTFVLIALTLHAKSQIMGFSILIVTAVILPVEFRSPSQNTLSVPFFIAAYLCASWVATAVFLRRRAVFDSSPVSKSALVFVAIILVSFVVGLYPWFPGRHAPLGAQVAGMGLFLFSICLFLAVGHQIKDLSQLRKLTWLFLGTGACISITGVLIPEGSLAQWGKMQSSVGSVFWTWLVGVSFSQALINRALSPRTRLFLFCLTAITLYRCVFLAFSWVSGWLPALVALAIILLFRLPRLGVCLAFLAVPISLLLASEIWGTLMVNEQYSYTTRVEAWRVLFQIIERNPLLGLGPANYYFYTMIFPILGWHVSFNSHSNYIDLLAQTGILGFFAFCWLAFEMFRMATRLRLRVPGGFAQAYVIGALGSLVGTLISGILGDWIIPFYYNIGILGFRSSLLFWVFMGGVLAMKRMFADQSEFLTYSQGLES